MLLRSSFAFGSVIILQTKWNHVCCPNRCNVRDLGGSEAEGGGDCVWVLPILQHKAFVFSQGQIMTSGEVAQAKWLPPADMTATPTVWHTHINMYHDHRSPASTMKYTGSVFLKSIKLNQCNKLIVAHLFLYTVCQSLPTLCIMNQISVQQTIVSTVVTLTSSVVMVWMHQLRKRWTEKACPQKGN